jgi:hypothetical protein
MADLLISPPRGTTEVLAIGIISYIWDLSNWACGGERI